MQKRSRGDLGEIWENDMQYTMERSLERTWHLFLSWVIPGFYADHLKKVYRHFPEEQVLVMWYDDLKAERDLSHWKRK